MKYISSVFRFLKPYAALVAFALFFMAIEVGANILQPKYMESIINDGLLRVDMASVRINCILMLSVALIGGVGGYTSCVFSNIYSQKFGNALRKAVFEKAIKSESQKKTDGIDSGAVITRLTMDTRVVSEFSSILVQMLFKPVLLFVFGIVMILTINVYFGLILLVALPLQIGVMIFFIKRSSKFFRTIQKLTDGLNRFALFISSNSRLIKSSVTEKYEAGRFNQKNTELTDEIYTVQRFMAIFNPLITLILNGVMILVIVIGDFQVQAGMIMVGSIMAAISYSQQIMISMMTVGGVFQHVARSVTSAERLTQILDEETPDESARKALDAPFETLSFENVTFRYPQNPDARLPVLDGVDLTVRRGEKVGIIGTTGAGKSTLAHLAVMLYEPTAGRIAVNGEDMRGFSAASVREKIAIVFQDSDVFSGSLRENIVKGLGEYSPEDFDKATATALVDEFAANMPEGYETSLSDRGTSVSGGQRQRIAIARALVRDPELLIMDDCTSSLDSKTEAAVFENIAANYPGLTVIVISQRVSSVMDADRIVLLDNGAVGAVGTHGELCLSSDSYASLYRAQCAIGGDVGE